MTKNNMLLRLKLLTSINCLFASRNNLTLIIKRKGRTIIWFFIITIILSKVMLRKGNLKIREIQKV